MFVKINSTWYEANDAVVKRMEEYYEAGCELQRRNEALIAALSEFKQSVEVAKRTKSKEDRIRMNDVRSRLLNLVPDRVGREMEINWR